MNNLFNDVMEINRRLFDNIWNLAGTSLNSIKGLSPRLIIPRKRDDSDRISEQEARFLYVSLLNTTNYFYSVETPTEKTYQQTGDKPISAASDLSLYINEYNTLKKVLNIEFKAHNPSKEHIEKDIEKLIKEDVPGCWIHLFKNVDSKTMKKLLEEKIEESVKKFKNDVQGEKQILFSICIMNKKIGLQKLLNVKEDNIEKFFKFDYSIKDGKLVIDDENGWILYSQGREVI